MENLIELRLIFTENKNNVAFGDIVGLTFGGGPRAWRGRMDA
ncbi:hypothetical protein FrEUN1fDRAFT_4064 [Parafrankia sp. EUN1f]|nr:hypothetical protein FrEUN1fDRAFT_4064 [Parafrankia sp. EUN1f]